MKYNKISQLYEKKQDNLMRFNFIGGCYRNDKHDNINGDVHTEYLTISQVIDFDKNDVMNATI